jgi:hypothetical protein
MKNYWLDEQEAKKRTARSQGFLFLEYEDDEDYGDWSYYIKKETKLKKLMALEKWQQSWDEIWAEHDRRQNLLKEYSI